MNLTKHVWFWQKKEHVCILDTVNSPIFGDQLEAIQRRSPAEISHVEPNGEKSDKLFLWYISHCLELAESVALGRFPFTKPADLVAGSKLKTLMMCQSSTQATMVGK